MITHRLDTDKLVAKKIQKIPIFHSLPFSAIKIKRLHGGGSNISYFIEALNKKFVLRITRHVHDYIKKFHKYEIDNMLILQSIGLGVKVYYFDPIDSTILMEYIENEKTLTPRDFHEPDGNKFLELCVTFLKTLHNAKIRFNNDVNVFHKIRQLFNFLNKGKGKIFLSEIYSAKLSKIYRLENILQQLNIKKYPCHNDVSPYNCLLTINGLKLIDWERAGNNDPAWDLSYLICSANLNFFQEENILKIYNRNNDRLFRERVIVYKPIIEYWKALWTLFQLIDGSDFLSEEMFLKIARDKIHTCCGMMQEYTFIQAICMLQKQIELQCKS